MVSPLVQQLIKDGVGEDVGNGVSFVEVELDSPTIGGLMMRYGVSSILVPLLCLRRGVWDEGKGERDKCNG